MTRDALLTQLGLVATSCRLVKHIGQRTQREKAIREAAWKGCWSGGDGLRAAWKNRAENKSVSGPLCGCALLCRCAEGCRGE